MARYKIVYATPLRWFNSDWLSDLFNQYFEFEPWDPDRSYDPGTGFYVNCLDFNTTSFEHTKLVDQGFRVFVDNLCEVNPGPIDNVHIVHTPRWCWYNESLWYAHRGYDQYQPNRQPQFQALMPMNLVKPHRTEFLQRLGTLKDHMMWSYVGQGRQLPNDGDMTHWDTQRRFNPEWYDQCYISMVVESTVRDGHAYTPVFITEKTYKPMAFEHPFVVYGNHHTLKTLRDWGFVTFDNLWDESYDSLLSNTQRRAAIVRLLRQIEIKTHDTETIRRLKQNRAHFYNRELIIDRIVKEIIEPILNYAET